VYRDFGAQVRKPDVSTRNWSLSEQEEGADCGQCGDVRHDDGVRVRALNCQWQPRISEPRKIYVDY
jgi:hypothetical protein